MEHQLGLYCYIVVGSTCALKTYKKQNTIGASFFSLFNSVLNLKKKKLLFFYQLENCFIFLLRVLSNTEPCNIPPAVKKQCACPQPLLKAYIQLLKGGIIGKTIHRLHIILSFSFLFPIVFILIVLVLQKKKVEKLFILWVVCIYRAERQTGRRRNRTGKHVPLVYIPCELLHIYLYIQPREQLRRLGGLFLLPLVDVLLTESQLFSICFLSLHCPFAWPPSSKKTGWEEIF